ncbi:MAG: HDOD domain-containing protein [Thermodesulfobacteriota bacterium]
MDDSSARKQAAPPSPLPNIFVARQPIFDASQRVYAYELLFRNSLKNSFDPTVCGSRATSNVISSSFFVLGIQQVTQGKKAFINFSDELLLQEYPMLCDSNLTVIELLESATLSQPLVDICRKLTRRGFLLALDDFVYSPEWEPFLDLAHIIKFDMRSMERAELERQLERIDGHRRRRDIKLLAEKVETFEEFRYTGRLGFTYFQGYFFSRPNIITGRDLPVSKLHLLRLIQQINDPNHDFVALGKLVANDVALSYKLLKFINSAWFGLRVKVQSLQSAVALLGEDNFRKWLSLIALSAMAADKPPELFNLTVFRGAFCEEVARLMAGVIDAGVCHTIGMFSLLDAILDRPMGEIVAELSLSDTISDALLGKKPGLHAAPLYLLRAYEHGRWQAVETLATNLRINQALLPGIFEKALQTVDAFSSSD